MTVVLLLVACRQPDDVNVDQKGRETLRQEQLAQRSWAAWAGTRLRAGTGDLVAAVGSLHPNDWGVADSFDWELTFRQDRPVDRRELMRALRRACSFPPARNLTSLHVTAHLVVRGRSALVPTVVETFCEDGYGRLAPWLDHLARNPLPAEVRGSGISVRVAEEAEDGFVRLLVSSSDGTTAVADRIRRYACAAPRSSRLVVEVRTAEHPSAVTDLGSSRPIPTEPC